MKKQWKLVRTRKIHDKKTEGAPQEQANRNLQGQSSCTEEIQLGKQTLQSEKVNDKEGIWTKVAKEWQEKKGKMLYADTIRIVKPDPILEEIGKAVLKALGMDM